MDKFSYTIFLKNLEDNPLLFTEEQFEENLLTLSPEDLEEVHTTLSNAPDDIDTSRHVVRMLSVIWHYR